jgi:hypothetical protein
MVVSSTTQRDTLHRKEGLTTSPAKRKKMAHSNRYLGGGFTSSTALSVVASAIVLVSNRERLWTQ